MKQSRHWSVLLPRSCLELIPGTVRFTFAVILVSITINTTSSADSDDISLDPIQLIQAMSDSLRSLTYEGTFVTLSQGQLDTMQIKQINDGVTVNEQLTSLNGESREIFRNNEFVTCIWPKSQSVIYMKSKKRESSTRYDYTLNDNYLYTQSADDRIAGRETYVIAVVAKDTQRYSYRLWIDKTTKMLLQSMSLDENNVPVEQMMFTTIRFDGNIAIDDVAAKLRQLDYNTQNFSQAVMPTIPQNTPVHFTSLPDGYSKVSDRYHPMPTGYDPVRHIFLSDGMSSISVYVQFDYTPTDDDAVGLYTLGGVAAYGRQMGTSFTTVIGGVPAQTVRTVAQAVEIDRSVSFR